MDVISKPIRFGVFLIVGLILLLFVIIVVDSMAGHYFNQRKDVDTSKLIGFWTPDFPAPADQSGYYFLDDGRYVFKEIGGHQGKEYVGSSGTWSLDGGSITINKAREYYLRGDNVFCKNNPSDSVKIGQYDISVGRFGGVDNVTSMRLSNDVGLVPAVYVYSGMPSSREIRDIIDIRLNMKCLDR